MPGQRSKDWGMIKLVYVQGQWDKVTGESIELSLRSVATMSGVSYSQIRKHAKKEDWNSERDEYKRERDERVKQRLMRMGVKDMVSLQVQNMTASISTITEYMKQLRDPESKKSISAFEVLQHQKYIDERMAAIAEVEEEKAAVTPDDVMDFTFGEITEAAIRKARREE